MTESIDDALNLNDSATGHTPNIDDDKAAHEFRRVCNVRRDFERLQRIAQLKDDILKISELGKKGTYLTRTRLNRIYEILDGCHLLITANQTTYLDRFVSLLAVCLYKWNVKRHSIEDLINYICDTAKLGQTKNDELACMIAEALNRYGHLPEWECIDLLKFKLSEILRERRDDYNLEHLDAIVNEIKNALTVKRDPRISHDEVRSYAQSLLCKRILQEFPTLTDVHIYHLMKHVHISIQSQNIKSPKGVVTVFDKIILPSGELDFFVNELNRPVYQYIPYSYDVFLEKFAEIVEKVLYVHRIKRNMECDDKCYCSDLLHILPDLYQYKVLSKLAERKKMMITA